VADQSLSIDAVATDADASDILTITAAGFPASLSLVHVSSVSPATASLQGTPSSGDIGGYAIQWNVSDGFGGNASTTTQLTVTANSNPVVSAPASVPAAETVKVTFSVTVTDPDNDPANSLTTSALPAGATFVPSALNLAGNFEWTPSVGQQGDYSITFTVETGSPGRTGFATTMIHVGPVDRPPVITGVPGTINTVTSLPIHLNITVSDPDGDPINFFVMRGTQNTALPEGAVFTHNATNTTGTFDWTPTPTQNMTVTLDVIAESGVLNRRTLLVCKIVVGVDHAPVVTAPASVTVAEGMPLTVNVTVADPDANSPIASLTTSPLPFGATFTKAANNLSGQLSWTPDFTQAGVYPITFTATNALTGTKITSITVTNANRPPVANAGGPYSGVAGLPVNFNGSASTDPDGDVLTYAWDFGDAMTGTGATVGHTYAVGGSYPVSLTVSDGTQTSTASTTATISTGFDARVFTSGGNRSIKLNSGKPTWCVAIEPLNSSFSPDEVDLGTISLHYAGNSIPAIPGKTAVASDQDHNGVQEIAACFAKDQLRTLFSGLPGGHNTVTVSVEGTLVSGAHFTGSTDVDVVASGGTLAASLSPNPFNPQAVLTFSTHKDGPVRVRLYDASGRLVKTLLDESYLSAGIHDVRVGAHSESGARLSSGIYFYHVEAAEGSLTGRAVIVQ
jgi:PKD repeat protein